MYRNVANWLAFDESKSDVALQGEFWLASAIGVHTIGSTHQLALGL